MKGRVRFGWDVGDGPSLVDSPLQVIHQDDAVNEVDKWYKVEALRYNILIVLTQVYNILIVLTQVYNILIVLTQM